MRSGLREDFFKGVRSPRVGLLPAYADSEKLEWFFLREKYWRLVLREPRKDVAVESLVVGRQSSCCWERFLSIKQNVLSSIKHYSIRS